MCRTYSSQSDVSRNVAETAAQTSPDDQGPVATPHSAIEKWFCQACKNLQYPKISYDARASGFNSRRYQCKTRRCCQDLHTGPGSTLAP